MLENITLNNMTNEPIMTEEKFNILKHNCEIIPDIFAKLYEYQEKHDITNMCMPNSVFVYHLYKTYVNCDVKVKAVIYFNKLSHNIVLNNWAHLVVKINGDIFDPSIQYSQYEGNNYSETYKEFKGKFDKKTIESFKSMYDFKDLLTQHMKFTEYEKFINENTLDFVLKKFKGNPKMYSYYQKITKYTQKLVDKLKKI